VSLISASLNRSIRIRTIDPDPRRRAPSPTHCSARRPGNSLVSAPWIDAVLSDNPTVPLKVVRNVMGNPLIPCINVVFMSASNTGTVRDYHRLWERLATWIASSAYVDISDKSLVAYLHSQRAEGCSLAHCRKILAAVRYRTGKIHWPSTTRFLGCWETEERKTAA